MAFAGWPWGARCWSATQNRQPREALCISTSRCLNDYFRFDIDPDWHRLAQINRSAWQGWICFSLVSKCAHWRRHHLLQTRIPISESRTHFRCFNAPVLQHLQLLPGSESGAYKKESTVDRGPFCLASASITAYGSSSALCWSNLRLNSCTRFSQAEQKPFKQNGPKLSSLEVRYGSTSSVL